MIKPRKKSYTEYGPRKDKNKFHSKIGTKHPLPLNMKRSEYEQLRRIWDKKLAESGHVDIEKIDPSTGQAEPSFKASKLSHHWSATEQVNNMRPDKIEYFRLCRCFLEHADFSELFGSDSWLYHKLFELHCDGLAYRKIAKYFRSSAVPANEQRPKASEFWSHWHLQRILRIMWPWHRTHPEGLLLSDT